MGRFRNLEFNNPRRSGQVGSNQMTDQVRDANYYLRQADQERRLRCYENALRFYSRALEHDPTVTMAWVGQVRMLIGLEEYPEAELWSGKALERFRNHPDLLAGRSQACCRQGKFDEAYQWSDRSVAATGESAYRWQSRGELMLAKRERTADYCFQKAELTDTDWLVSLEIGEIYLHYGHAAQAQLRLRRVTERAPEAPAGWLLLARCQAKQGSYAQARRSFQMCLQLVPDHAEAVEELRDLERIAGAGWLRQAIRRWMGR